MPRLILFVAALALLAFVGPHLCPTIAAADSSEALTGRYMASIFRAMADTAICAPSDDGASTTLGRMVRNKMTVDETARFVLSGGCPTENPSAGAGFRQQFLHFVSNACVGALRMHRQITLRAERSPRSGGWVRADSGLVLHPGLALPRTIALERPPAHLDAVAALFDRVAVRAGATDSAASP
jgi:hypothetical protein